jgi:putative DNA primase/helicase
MAQPKTPALQPFCAEKIPKSLKDMPRWAPWKAVWNEKRNKYDKIPYRADAPAYGLSTARPDSWFSFDKALAAYLNNPGAFSGLGLVLTGVKGLVGTDLDNCITNGVVADWAQDIVSDLASYTEISPSGNGLRVFNTGTQEKDWNNHDVGIEVYGGNDARFLTVSGQHLDGTPTDIADVRGGVLQAMESQYAKVRVKATVIDHTASKPRAVPPAKWQRWTSSLT